MALREPGKLKITKKQEGGFGPHETHLGLLTGSYGSWTPYPPTEAGRQRPCLQVLPGLKGKFFGILEFSQGDIFRETRAILGMEVLENVSAC